MNHNNEGGAMRRKLTDILRGGDADSLRDQWDRAEAATDFEPLPGGTYTARILSGELFTARSGTPGYKLAFAVLEGEHAGRRFWHDVWLTATALPMAKRDLGKLGVASLNQLEKPLPPGIRVKAKVVLRRDDDGGEHNRVRTFEVVGVDTVDDPDFAPETASDDGSKAEADDAGDNGTGRLIDDPPADAVRPWQVGA